MEYRRQRQMCIRDSARMEHLAEDGEAKRDDNNFAYVAAWEYSEEGEILNKESLDFEFVKPSVRDYT